MLPHLSLLQMIAILLCAGFGTRMQGGGDGDGTPKPLLSVGEASFLDLIAQDLAGAKAIDALHVVANHRHIVQFRAWADVRGPEYEAALHVHDDGVETPDEQRGVVGDLRFVLDRVDVPTDGVCVVGGDSVYRFPLAPIVDAFDGQHSRVLALYEPDEDAQRHSSLLHLDGDRVQSIAPTGAETSTSDSDADGADPYVCPLFALLTSQDVRAVGPYLDAGHDPDDFGPFANTLAQTRRVEAVRLPKMAGLRLHCNTPDALEQARATLRDEPRLQISPEDLTERLGA